MVPPFNVSCRGQWKTNKLYCKIRVFWKESDEVYNEVVDNHQAAGSLFCVNALFVR